MAIEVFNRYEHKYFLDKETFERVIKVMDEHMVIDSHNPDHKPYTIANIYFDTPDDYLIRTSLSKPKYKEKLRLRAYGVPNLDSKVFLEIKKKFNGIVNKRRTALKLTDAYDFARTGKPPEIKDYMNRQVVSELEYFLKIYNLSPKLYLAYDRIAYFEKDNSDLRISFDMNIRSRRYDLKLEHGDYGKKLLPDGVYLMEIKTSLAKPLWLARMLSELDIKRVSFSKYGTEFRQMIHFEDEYKEVV
ncbi:MAG: polyphosphate polymerase domain-containing protein [Clostridia bacterium]|nr:polyphosphate polymerase domain-containing protein [Clostridia bacterium]